MLLVVQVYLLRTRNAIAQEPTKCEGPHKPRVKVSKEETGVGVGNRWER
jgi:hypothetical protein